MYVYMDEPNRAAFRTLRHHPKVRARLCDDEFWKTRKRQRPDKHQIRQTVHATFAYRNTHLDWLAHIDVDEFLWTSAPVRDLLHSVPASIPNCAPTTARSCSISPAAAATAPSRCATPTVTSASAAPT
ncbi:MAG: glycosyltransferase family 2 protein [Bacteroidota bacterium]